MHAYPCMQNNEETIAKYAVDANLFRLGSTNPIKKISSLKKITFFFFKNVSIFELIDKKRIFNFFSKVVKFTYFQIRLNRKKNKISDFSDFFPYLYSNHPIFDELSR